MAEQAVPMIRVIGFHQTYEKVGKRNEYGDKVLDDKGNPVLEVTEEDWVTYAPAHAPISTQNCERVRHMRPTDDMRDTTGQKSQFMKARWDVIEPAYEAWKKGHEIPLDGTPFSQWPGVSSTQAEILRKCSIRTVEEVRDMTDSQISRVAMPNVRELRKNAAIFLENRGAAEIAAREAERDSKVAELEDKLAAAMELLEQRTAPTSKDDEVAELHAALDERGIPYHHKAGPAKLRELLESAQEAA